MSPSTVHLPVLPAEVLAGLAPQPGQVFVDGTSGGGGHTRLLAERVGPAGLVLALDRDAAAVERTRAACAELSVRAVQASYDDLAEVLEAPSLAERVVGGVQGILLDLGLSSDQLADGERGFSFQVEGPLDLRFDVEEGEPAWRMIERMREKDLADMIYQYGEERFSRRIARAIVERRPDPVLRTARGMADLVSRCVPRSRDTDRIHPATRTFQALRIAVNDELGILERALARLPDCLRPGGRLAIISFHSLEDRMVKNAFRGDERLTNLTKKPIVASEEEVQQNPRAAARS